MKTNSITVTYKSVPDEGALGGVRNLISNLVSMRYVFYVLLIGNINKRYKGSYLGVLWALFNPVVTMLGMAIVFPLIMKFKTENYIVYLFSGVIIWGFISASLTSGGDSIINNQSLIQKIYLPKIIFPYVLATSEFINLLIATAAFHFIAYMFDMRVNTNVGYLIAALATSYVFGMGVASVTSVMIVYFRDLKYIIGVVMQSLFFVSGIIFPLSAIPEKYVFYLELNPFYHYIRLFHEAIYNGTGSNWSYFIAPVVMSFVLLVSGLLLQWRLDRAIMYRL